MGFFGSLIHTGSSLVHKGVSTLHHVGASVLHTASHGASTLAHTGSKIAHTAAKGFNDAATATGQFVQGQVIPGISSGIVETKDLAEGLLDRTEDWAFGSASSFSTLAWGAAAGAIGLAYLRG